MSRYGLGELHSLLRRCHHDELEALALRLGVNTAGLAFGRLAKVTAISLRRHGGHALGNIFIRGGQGPAYDVLLRQLAERCKVVVSGATGEELELRIATWWLAKSFDELEGERRVELWNELGLSGDAPATGEDAVALAKSEYGHRFAYVATHVEVPEQVRTALMLLQVLNPIARILMVVWLFRPRDDIVLPAVLEVARLRQVVRHRVTVGVVGSPSAGKDAGIGAIFGVATGNVSPIAGSTRTVSITRLEGSTALYVVNTPGMGDVVESVTEEARQILDHIDVFVYVVNAQGGVQAREKEDYNRCVRRRRPVLVVVNKVDTLRERDRQRLIEDCRNKLGADPLDLIAAAFDPLPQLADAPIGLEEVQQWLTAKLVELGKDPSELPWERDEEQDEPKDTVSTH